MSELLLEIAKKSLAIQDVFLVECKISLKKDFNQTAAEHTFDAQMKHAVDKEILLQARRTLEGQEIKIARYFADVGFRVVNATEEATELKKIDVPVIGEVEARFAADYLVTSQSPLSSDVLGTFSVNVMYHVWPYWREYLQSALGRMRLPPIALPMLTMQQIQSELAVEQTPAAL